MRSKLYPVFMTILLTLGVTAQTADEFKKRYEPTVFLEVRPNILMKAEYSSKGEVCNVVFQPNHYSIKEKTVFVGNSTIDLYDLLDVIDELVPASTRKGKGESLGWIIQGGMMWGGFTFDNLRINTKRAASDKNRRTLEKRPNDNGDLIDYLNSFGSPESASISWTKRLGCIEKS